MPAAKGFPKISTGAAPTFSRAMRGSIVLSANGMRHALLDLDVNTSLSRTLFFSMCWCIREVVHFDSRVHAAIKPSHYSGGQHGQESEEGEEGEERSEEDCEEDPQGLEEEEVTFAFERMPVSLMPARRESLRAAASRKQVSPKTLKIREKSTI